MGVVSDTGKKTTMMSTRNFYNAMTPGRHLGEEVMFGKSAYKQIAPSELNSKYVRNANKMPLAREGSLLNSINDHGLLSYTDFHFLLLLMSTPTRYLDIIFHGFDISADGSVEAKEFVHVLARIANAKIDPDQLMREGATSGLVRYLFGDDLSGGLTKVDPHVIEVVYCLLDEDGDRNLSTKEFNPVLFSWRHSRGFQNGALSVTLGNMKF